MTIEDSEVPQVQVKERTGVQGQRGDHQGRSETPIVTRDNQTSTNTKRLECPALPRGWFREEVYRRGGVTAGKCDIYYYTPSGKKVRSNPQLIRLLRNTVDLSTFDYSTGIMNSTPIKPRSRMPKTVKERTSGQKQRDDRQGRGDKEHRAANKAQPRSIPNKLVDADTMSVDHDNNVSYDPFLDDLVIDLEAEELQEPATGQQDRHPDGQESDGAGGRRDDTFCPLSQSQSSTVQYNKNRQQLEAPAKSPVVKRRRDQGMSSSHYIPYMRIRITQF
jgi:hypothetical protein